MQDERLYKANREALVTYADRLSGKMESGKTGDGEDIVQEAWILLNRQANRQPLREPLAYLKTIIRNLVLSRHRSLARQRRHGRVEDADPDTILSIVADEQPGPEASLLARDAVKRVMACIESLPRQQRIAFQLYHLEGLTLRETALRLGLSVSRVHELVARAMTLCDQARRVEGDENEH